MSVATAAAWKVRHEGSPRSIEGLSLTQVVEGLEDGLWETSDEVMGPDDSQWVAIESHPVLAGVAADMEPPMAPEHEDETRLDMNPLIDVALVLLIVFILTMTYAALQKVLQMPETKDAKNNETIARASDIDQYTIKVTARQVDGKPQIKVEDQVVDEKDLTTALRQWVRKSKKVELSLDAKGVTWGTIVTIADAAKGAGIQTVHQIRQKTTP